MLTVIECQNAVCPPEKKKLKLADSGGLFLLITPNGAKRWFWKYRASDGRTVELPLGHYARPGSAKVEIGLKAARLARDEARSVHLTGADPLQQRAIAKATERASAATTFGAVAQEFHQSRASGWSATHAAQWLRCCEKDLFPWIGGLPIKDVSAPVLLDALRRVEARGALQLVRDLREFAGQVFKYGIQTGKCETNPARELTGAFKAHTVKHAAAILDPKGVGKLLRDMAGYQGQPSTRTALLISALLFQRPGNIRAMEWAWIDLDKAMLTIPAAVMKRTKTDKLNGRPHFVPLSEQALAALRDLKPLTGAGRYVFPSLRTGDKPMSENTVNSALRGLGYTKDQMSSQGFRSLARTVMTEHLAGVDPQVIEAQLAHKKSGPLGEAYDRAQYMAQRRTMMQTWADYLDQLRRGAEVISIGGRAA